MARGVCSIQGCDGSVFGHGWCQLHYQHWYRNGDPLDYGKKHQRPKSIEPLDWFWSFVDSSGDGCHEWQGVRSIKGYGTGPTMFGTDIAHRIVYMLANGPIPSTTLVCHACDNPPCCRIDHLFAGTPAMNSQDMVDKGRSIKGRHPERCIHGHLFDEANTYIVTTPGREGQWQCRTCARIRAASRRPDHAPSSAAAR